MHIYKRELVTSQGSQLILPLGETAQCWEIGFPPEGRITRLLVRQVSAADGGGTASAFTVNLFDRQVCDLGSGNSVSVEAADEMTQAMAKIIPTQSVLSGAILELREGATNGGPWSYRNREGTFTVPTRAVYLHISLAANADGKEFEVAIEARVGGEQN